MMFMAWITTRTAWPARRRHTEARHPNAVRDNPHYRYWRKRQNGGSEGTQKRSGNLNQCSLYFPNRCASSYPGRHVKWSEVGNFHLARWGSSGRRFESARPDFSNRWTPEQALFPFKCPSVAAIRENSPSAAHIIRVPSFQKKPVSNYMLLDSHY
jgi:hypothetical protein